MNRKPQIIFNSLLAGIALVTLLWAWQTVHRIVFNPLNNAQPVNITASVEFTPSDERQVIKETIFLSRKILAEAEYTFDTSQLAKVYINDPRGGEITDGALATIQKTRNDQSIEKDQVGLLDYEQALYLEMKQQYNNYIADLTAKQANGTINDEEQHNLDWETKGWQTTEPETMPNPTQSCPVMLPSSADISKAYPATKSMLEPTSTLQTNTTNPPQAYPAPILNDPSITEIPHCPTPIATTVPLRYKVPYRGINPTLLSPEAFNIDIKSISIEGDLARAEVFKSGVTSEYVLVKVNSRWYIAGTKLLKYAP